jgi:hypothetical protein
MCQHIVHRPTAELRAFVTGGLAAAMLYPRVRQHVSCVAAQRDAILGSLANIADLRGVPTVGPPGLGVLVG